MGKFPGITLKDGRIATVSYLSKKDSTRELLRFINKLIREKTYLLQDRPFSMKAEEQWKKSELSNFKKRQSYLLVARVDGKIAATSGAKRRLGAARNNVELGIAVAKEFRRIGLGEGMLRLNIKTAKTFFKPKPRNIYLTVFKANKPAYALYRKLGFREFAVMPDWFLHRGKYIDMIALKL